MTIDAVACTTDQTLLGEGARWDARRGELLVVDFMAGHVYRDRVDDDGALVRLLGRRPVALPHPTAIGRQQEAASSAVIVSDQLARADRAVDVLTKSKEIPGYVFISRIQAPPLPAC